MQTFYAPKEAFAGSTVVLTGDEYRHAARSCRVRVGEIIGVTDGCGRRVEARIETIDGSAVTAGIVDDVSGIGEPAFGITVAPAVIKPSRFEQAVERCTELGARRFLPVIARRCETAPDRLNYERMNRIAFEAAKQSRRSWLPRIEHPVMLTDIFEHAEGTVLAALQSAEYEMDAALKAVDTSGGVTIVIGPEGDFTDEERDVLLTGGAVPVSLGGLTLRTETAAIAATVLCSTCGRKTRREKLFG